MRLGNKPLKFGNFQIKSSLSILKKIETKETNIMREEISKFSHLSKPGVLLRQDENVSKMKRKVLGNISSSGTCLSHVWFVYRNIFEEIIKANNKSLCKQFYSLKANCI